MEPDFSEAAGRLPAHLEVSGLVRRAGLVGGFATVLARGEADAGTIVLVLTDRGAPARAFERMPGLDGRRRWTLARSEDPADPGAFAAWLERRRIQDGDLWIVELDVPVGEQFIEHSGSEG